MIDELKIARLTLARGDVLVVRSERPLTREQIHQMRGHMKGLLPEGVSLMIIDRSFDLAVLTRAQIDELTKDDDDERG